MPFLPKKSLELDWAFRIQWPKAVLTLCLDFCWLGNILLRCFNRTLKLVRRILSSGI